jgi:UDP-N-acetylglucosamine 2-epimerase (non-hydrolysing)
VSVVGARTQFIKLFPISHAIPDGVEHEIIHTGQHYDESMSQVFFDELSIPKPLINLNIGSGSHAQQTSAMMLGLENAFLVTKPDVVLVYGDTNSTLAASLVASKMKFPLVHLEAGLRSFNKAMPEELNRIVTDHLSDLLLAPTNSAIGNLAREGLGNKSINVGDVMVDAILLAEKMINRLDLKIESDFARYIFCTLHRAENTNNPSRLRKLISNISKSTEIILLAAHPRLVDTCSREGINLNVGSIRVVQPQTYLNTINLVKNSLGVITDSGGLQKEAFLLKKNILTLREETEWIETLEHNQNTLDPNAHLAGSNWFEFETRDDSKNFGDGNSSLKILNAISEKFF